MDQETGPPTAAPMELGPVAGSPVAAASSSLPAAEPASKTHPLPPAVLTATSPTSVPFPTRSSSQHTDDHLDSSVSTLHHRFVDCWTDIAAAVPMPPSPGLGPQVSSQVPEMPTAVTVDGQQDGTIDASASYSPGTSGESSTSQCNVGTACPEDEKLNRPVVSTSYSAPLARLPKSPPQDLSGQSASPLPAAPPTLLPSVSLANLAHLIRLQGCQQRRHSDARVRHYHSAVSTGLSARLVNCGVLATRDLVDYLRVDRKSVFASLGSVMQDGKDFASLHNVMHDIRDSCDLYRRYSLLEPELDSTYGQGKAATAGFAPQSFTTFMDEIPGKARDDFLDLLTEIRTNPDFLASRIASLEQQDLASLTNFGLARDALDPVVSPRGKTARTTQAQQHQHGKPQVPTPVDRLLSFQRHDPLLTLIHTVFASSAGLDTTEDLRRIDIWATTCASLFAEGKAGSDRLVLSILDIWATMGDWASRSRMEFYLMELLQKGQFLLDRLEESHAGFNRNAAQRTGLPSMGPASDSTSAEDFYAWAVRRLFEVLEDDQDAVGIPQGAIDIGAMILCKLDNRKNRMAAISLIVRRWFISTFLFNAIKHPEAHGMMHATYISEKARQRILGEVALRVQGYAPEINYNWNQTNPSQPDVQAYIDSIIARFDEGSEWTNSILSQIQLKLSDEISEERQFLTVCPSDLVTIVRALFPERRSTLNPFESAIEVSSIESTVASISGTTVPFRSISDGSSVLSLSASSATSDTISRETIFDCSSPGNRSSWTDEDCQSDIPKVQPMEQWGRRLRSACSDMAGVIGVKACAGSCHPCAEKWAILYVSPDGEELTTRMHGDVNSEDADAGDGDLSQNDVEHENADTENTDLARDHQMLRDAISKLLREYKLPSETGRGNEGAFGYRSSFLRRSTKSSYHVRADAEGQGHFFQNSYQNYNYDTPNSSILAGEQKLGFRSIHRSRSTTVVSPTEIFQEGPSVLVTMFRIAIQQCEIRSDFLSAHYYYKALKQLQRLITPSSTHHDYASLLNKLAHDPRRLLERTTDALEALNTWSAMLKQLQDYQNDQVSKLMQGARLLRDKMWYMADVRHSSCYEDTRNVVRALKIMGQPVSNVDRLSTISTSREQRRSNSSDTRFLARAEAQHVSLLAAPVELGGPRKLADDQSDITYRWLTELNIENFCKGEERIHRFCLEINKCINKLLGDDMLQGPVLWSSELYSREREVFDHGSQSSLLGAPRIDNLNLDLKEETSFTQTDQPKAFSFDFSSRAHRSNLKTNTDHSSSQQSSTPSRQKVGLQGKPTESKDLASFPPDSMATLWSPIPIHSNKRTQASPITQRPVTAAASSASLTRSLEHQRPATYVSEEKRQFLRDLRHVVAGLLLSDFGITIFPQGSETDHWFSGEIGYTCLQRKEAKEHGILEKRKFRDPQSGVSNAGKVTEHVMLECPAQSSPSKISTDVKDNSNATFIADNSVMAPLPRSPDTYTQPSTTIPDNLMQPEFCYHDAFRRLLSNFAIHPNPFTKLKILHELEQLIIASLTSSQEETCERTQFNKPSKPLSRNLESVPLTVEAAKMEQKAAEAAYQPSNPNARRIHDDDQQISKPNTSNMIIDVYLKLFRDPLMRPKNIFRDLQYIATFVPADILEKSVGGQALWNAGLAALSMKQDICQMMVELADDIVAFNTQQRDASLKAAAANSKEGKKQDGRRRNALTEPTIANGCTKDQIFPNSAAPSAPTSNAQDGLQIGGNIADPSLLGTASNISSHDNLTLPSSHDNLTLPSTTISNISPPDNSTVSATSGMAPKSSNQPSAEPPLASSISLSRYTMADAAAMLLITAKEGDAVAERELATFYLSEPDLLPLAIAPLTRPRDVFKADLIASVSAGSNSSSTGSVNTGRSGSVGSSNTVGGVMVGDGMNGTSRNDIFRASGRASGLSRSRGGVSGNHGATDDKARSDPVTMCVAQHWMELSARGGDRLARKFLLSKDEMERIRSV